MIVICPVGPEFDRWRELLSLIQVSFAYMDGRIDPPSSATRLSAESLVLKAQEEHGFVAEDAGQLIGCVFAAEHPRHFYVGKLAIAPESQGKGIGKLLITEVERLAISVRKPILELQVRIELKSNQEAFSRMGFMETGRTAHPGFSRPTSITMRKALA